MANVNRKDIIEIDHDVSIMGNIMMMVICFAIILPVFIKNIHSGYQYILVCIGLQVISILFGLWNIKKSRPAINILPVLAFDDILIYTALFVSNIPISHKNADFQKIVSLFSFSDYLKDQGFQAILIVSLVVLVFAFFVSLSHSDIFFSVLFSLEGVVLSLFYVWRGSSKSAYGRCVLAVTLIVTLVWIFICTYCNLATKGVKRNTSFFSFVFSFIVFSFNSYMANNGTKGFNVFFKIPKQLTDAVVRKMYPWWLVILMIVIFLACGTILGIFADYANEDKIKSYVDAKLFYGMAIIVFLSKIILSNYFSYSIILYVFLLFAICYELKKNIQHTATKKENKGLYNAEDLIFSGMNLIYFIICYLFVIQMAENMLYLTLAVAIAIMIMLLVLIKNFFKKYIFEEEIESVLVGLPKSYYVTIITLAVLLTATFVFYYRFSASNFIYLGIVLLTILLVFGCLKRKIPNNINLPEIKTVKWCITVFSVVFCIALTASTGAKVNMEYNVTKHSTEISVSTNKKASIKKIEYKWDNSVIYDRYQLLTAKEKPVDQKTLSKKIKKKKKKVEFNLPVEGERLTVRITDSNGVKTTRTLWYPIWFDSKY